MFLHKLDFKMSMLYFAEGWNEDMSRIFKKPKTLEKVFLNLPFKNKH